MYLQRAEPDEAKTIYALVSSNAMVCNVPVETMSFEQFKELVFDNSFYFWWRDKQDVYALVNIGALEPQSRKAEFGVISLRRRQGHAAAACYAVLKYGFETLNLHRMYALVNSDNLPSVRLCQKYGMVLEGEIRQGRFKAGQYVDQLMFGVLSSEVHIWNPGERRTEDAPSGNRSSDGGSGRRQGNLGQEASEEGGQGGSEDKKGVAQLRLA